MNKSKERVEINSSRVQRPLNTSIRNKNIKNSKSGVQLSSPKPDKIRNNNQSYYFRNSTVHNNLKTVEEIQNWKSKQALKVLGSTKLS